MSDEELQGSPLPPSIANMIASNQKPLEGWAVAVTPEQMIQAVLHQNGVNPYEEPKVDVSSEHFPLLSPAGITNKPPCIAIGDKEYVIDDILCLLLQKLL